MVMSMPARGRPSRSAIFRAVDDELAELVRIGGLPRPGESAAIWEGIWYEETHNSTAIEGNTLVLKEVRSLLEAGQAVGGKALAEYLEVEAYGAAARWVYEQAVDAVTESPAAVTLTEVRNVHTLVIEAVWRVAPPDDLDPDEGPGSFRRHDIQAFPSGMRPPAFTDVPAQMTDWVTLANAGPWPTRHLLEHVAELHARFEQIHPFRDGNGRTGRLLLNLLLVRRGYPPAMILKRSRARYLSALGRADHGDIGQLSEVVARAVKLNLDRFLLPGLAGPYRLLPITALATRDLSPLALRRAAEKGRLRAEQRDGRWYSTKQAVARYAASRRRGRRPSA